VPFSDKPDAPGPAYLLVEGHLLILDAGKLSTVEDLTSYLGDLKLAPDGAVWVGGSSVYRIAQGVAERQGRNYPMDVCLGDDGTVWEIASKEITGSAPDGKTTTLPLPDGDRPRFIGVSGKGELFVAGKQLHQRDGSGWKPVKAPKVFGNDPSFHGFVRRPGGALFAFSLTGAGKLGDDGAWSAVSLSSMLLIRAGTVSAAGVVAAFDSDEIAIAAPGARTEKKSIKTLGIAAERIDAVAVDGQGRRWVSTDGGLAILSPKGQLLQHWPPGSLPGPVSRILLVGAGPALPAAPSEVVKGTVTGKLFSSGAVVASSPVEICTVPSLLMVGGDSPCKHNAVRFSGKTDASGVFSFSGVPRQPYSLAFKQGKKWAVVLGSTSCCSGMTQGEAIDLGEVRLTR
jgi:hypothetical protein